LERKDRIADLCNRATTEEDPAALKKILDDLRSSLAEYMREARRMTVLHFDYFRKHDGHDTEQITTSNDAEAAGNRPAETPVTQQQKKAS
jgi:hypothetical protein